MRLSLLNVTENHGDRRDAAPGLASAPRQAGADAFRE